MNTRKTQENKPQSTARTVHQKRSNDLSTQQNSQTNGLPPGLKAGIEHLSGYSMDEASVHQNSAKPAQLQAQANAQGTDMHLAPGQERQLPHEAWHVVQQKQSHVKPGLQKKATVPINDDKGLEKEADRMGNQALQMHTDTPSLTPRTPASTAQAPVQRVTDEIQQGGITTGMRDRWNIVYPKLRQLVNTSAFGGSVKHSVLLWAASSGSLPVIKNDLGATYLYMSNDDTYAGYTDGDYGSFSQIMTPYNFSATPGRAYRIVIVFNLTRNTTAEELYTTFLHEWYVHALPWMTDAIAGTNVTDGNTAREKNEHKTYANQTNNDLDGYVNSLNLDSGVDKVTTKLRNDRDRYDKNTGDLK